MTNSTSTNSFSTIIGSQPSPAQTTGVSLPKAIGTSPVATVPPNMRTTSAAPLRASVAHTSAASLPTAIADNWGKIGSLNLDPEMLARIMRLAAAAGATRSLTSRSLNDFLDFWKLVRFSATAPELTVAPDGTLYAEWFKSRRQRLDLRFTPRAVIFGLIDGNTINEGAQPAEIVAATLKAHPSKPLRWSI